MKKSLLFILLSFTFMSNTCKNENVNCHNTITFHNRWGKTVYISISDIYPDTVHFTYSYPSPVKNPQFHKVISNSINRTGLRILSGDCYEELFHSKISFPNDTLIVNIFDEEVLESNAWEDIGNNYMVLQRYDLSLQDLQQLNWQISYPPTEAMKDMKMYPPYESK